MLLKLSMPTSQKIKNCLNSCEARGICVRIRSLLMSLLVLFSLPMNEFIADSAVDYFLLNRHANNMNAIAVKASKAGVRTRV
jgi:hypothetical protein